MYTRMIDDMDVNCGTIIDGLETLDTAGQQIFDRILAIASGEMSKSESQGIGADEFAPWPIGVTG